MELKARTTSAVLLVWLSTSVGAQNRCTAEPRELAGQSARTRLDLVRSSATAHDDLIADATACGDAFASVERRRLKVDAFRDTIHVTLFRPVVRAAALGGLADARDDGTMWSGRGASLHGKVALAIDVGPIHGLAAPAVWWTQNRRFEFFPAADSTRSRFSSLYYDGLHSLDLPARHGATPITTFELGSSAIWASVRNLDVGLAAGPQAWGPGARAHLLLGQDAPGIPRVFVRTNAPLRTRLGRLSVSAFLGELTESRFFDRDPANDSRALWAWTAALSPGSSDAIAFGLGQGIMLTESPIEGATDQLFTLFARIRSADDGFRAWVEVGRMGDLPTLRQFLTVPYFGVAYVLGFEYARPVGSRSLMVSAEAVNLEQPRDIREIAPRDFYTSNTIPQGWTQRGRPLGVATGPGSQSQWLALDVIERRWSAGLFGERVRWNEDAFLRQYLPYANRHDVSVRAGARLGYVARGYEVAIQLSTGKRLNYLFQNGSFIPGLRTIDVSLPQLRLAFTPLRR